MKLKRGIAISIVLIGLAGLGILIYGVGYGLASYGPYAALAMGGAFIITGLLTGPLAWNLNHRQNREWAAVPERLAMLAPEPATAHHMSPVVDTRHEVQGLRAERLDHVDAGADDVTIPHDDR